MPTHWNIIIVLQLYGLTSTLPSADDNFLSAEGILGNIQMTHGPGRCCTSISKHAHTPSRQRTEHQHSSTVVWFDVTKRRRHWVLYRPKGFRLAKIQMMVEDGRLSRGDEGSLAYQIRPFVEAGGWIQCRGGLWQRCIIYLLKAYSPVNRIGSPQGFSLNKIWHKLNTIQNVHILQT